MNERTHPDSNAPDVANGQARQTDERRRGATEHKPKPKRSPWVRYLGIAGRDLAIIIVALAAIVFSVYKVRPIFTNQPKVAEALIKRVPPAKAALEPTPQDSTDLERLVQTPKFEEDRKAFAADLVKTGYVEPSRADSIAFYAVRESHLRGIPPAVVFGVMLTENSRFVRGAMSDVGAVGLMQIYPKVWLKALEKRFGRDLTSDSTNVKYGVYILSEYVKTNQGAVSQRDLTKGLLRYNGCVTGKHTPNCRTYPRKVQTHVERQGAALCGDKTLYDCIGKPFMNGLLARRETQ